MEYEWDRLLSKPGKELFTDVVLHLCKLFILKKIDKDALNAAEELCWKSWMTV